MKLSPASVRVLAFRARKKLAQRLAAKNETKEGARS
jgi:DNA-directed RNA polymerase specialized sigma24 family protein